MAKYDVECTRCEETFTVQLFGKIKDREWKLENHSWVCEDCKQKAFDEKRKAELEEAKTNSQELGLPELIGSEKQIAWAEKIRFDALSTFDKELSKHKMAEDFTEIYSTYITNNVQSKYWIDNRNSFSEFKFILDELVALKKQIQQNKIECSKEVVDAKLEATIRPLSEVITEIVAELSIINNDTIKIVFLEKLEIFRKTVKENDFIWVDGSWQRNIVSINGTIEDRVTEIAIKILSIGVTIRVYSDIIREKIKNCEYEVECKKWIYVTKDNTKFAISLHFDGYYDKAKKIRGAKYSRPYIVVPVENYEEVLDFSEVHGYKLTNCAKEVVKNMIDIKNNSIKVAPKIKKVETKEVIYNTLTTPNINNTEIDESLKDE